MGYVLFFCFILCSCGFLATNPQIVEEIEKDVLQVNNAILENEKDKAK